mmetsp:Transcript_12212/g.18337  ORF Transcript_12212/g.18337 Transcript_12212/m.18337 type:complete len:86 (-) Transcript_12212:47-304(-)
MIFSEFYPDHGVGQLGFSRQKESAWKEMINPRLIFILQKKLSGRGLRLAPTVAFFDLTEVVHGSNYMYYVYQVLYMRYLMNKFKM